MAQVHGASSAANALQQWQHLQATQPAAATSANQHSGGSEGAEGFDPFAGLGGSPQSSGRGAPCTPFKLDTMSALMQAQENSGAPGAGGLSHHQQKVFSALDTSGDGSVTKAELDQDFGAENKTFADFVMNKLDTDGDGAISQSEFGAGTTRGRGHHHRTHAGSAQGAQSPLASLLSGTQGASSSSTSNADGSSNTTITYADGSKVSMISPASASNTDNSVNTNTSSRTQANLLEQLIKLQAQLTAPPASTAAAATLAIG